MVGAGATLLDLLFQPGIQVRILGGSFEQSEKDVRVSAAAGGSAFPAFAGGVAHAAAAGFEEWGAGGGAVGVIGSGGARDAGAEGAVR